MSYSVDPLLHLASVILEEERNGNCVHMCGSPDEEVERLDDERRHHPPCGYERPGDVALLQQEEVGDQVGQNIRQTQNHIEECEFDDCKHLDGLERSN